MAAAVKIVWTDLAKDNLFQIYDQLAGVAEEDRAFAIMSSIIEKADIEKADILEQYPLAGPIEPLLAHSGRGHRRLIAGNYKLIYRVERDIVFINRVFDSRRNPAGMIPG